MAVRVLAIAASGGGEAIGGGALSGGSLGSSSTGISTGSPSSSSSSASTSSSAKACTIPRASPLLLHVVGLDCEWRPAPPSSPTSGPTPGPVSISNDAPGVDSISGVAPGSGLEPGSLMRQGQGLGNGHTSEAKLGAAEEVGVEVMDDELELDYPVATLQLSTRAQAFIVDLQTLCNHDHNHNNDNSNSNTAASSSSSSSSPRSPTSTATTDNYILTECEELLSTALTELFTHIKIHILGFSVSQDLRKMAASFPHMLCFQRVVRA